MNTNIILNVDSYKTSHFLQYPPGAEIVSSYIESRGGEYNHSVFFGLQMYLKAYLAHAISQADIDEAESILPQHGVPFNRAGWQHILDTHGGYLPIRIEAVPEGSLLPVSNVLLQVTNTDISCAWLTSYIETALLRAIWYPTTIATRAFHCRQIIRAALSNSGENADDVEFKLQDFGARGASSMETAAIGGSAHLLSFSGTDNLNAITSLRRYYDADIPGFSIPAAEHSTVTCWGRENEGRAYANMLDKFSGPDKTVAVVSDSYDLFGAIERLWGCELRQRVVNNGGTVVIRPDSGDPVTIVCETIQRLMDKFGKLKNSKGFYVLPQYIRVIQGDGVSPATISQILSAMHEKRLSADNVAFGMGGELLQTVNRDTMKFAMKASAIRVSGRWQDVFKDPITDTGKRSKRGRLSLLKTDDTVETTRRTSACEKDNLLQPVFENGQLLRDETFEQIRNRLHESAGTLRHQEMRA